MSSLAASPPGRVEAPDLRRQLARAERRRKLRAFALTLPLLVFLLLTFLVPIAALLKRAVENPEVANALPRTVAALQGWDREGTPARRGLRRDRGRPRRPARQLGCRRAGAAPEQRDARRTLAGDEHLQGAAAGRHVGVDAGGRLPGPPARARRALGRDALLAGDRQERLALDAGLPARLGRPAARCAGRMSSACEPDQRAFGRILVRTFEISADRHAVVPAAGLPARLLAVHAARRGRPTC